MVQARGDQGAPWSLAHKMRLEEQQQQRRMQARTGVIRVSRPRAAQYKPASQVKTTTVRSKGRSRSPLQGRLLNSPFTRDGRPSFDSTGHLRLNRVSLCREYGVRTDLLHQLDKIGGQAYRRMRCDQERDVRTHMQKTRHRRDVVSLVVEKANAVLSASAAPEEWQAKLKAAKRPITVDPSVHRDCRGAAPKFQRPHTRGQAGCPWELGVSTPYADDEEPVRMPQKHRFPGVVPFRTKKSRNRGFQLMRTQDIDKYSTLL